MNWKKIDIKAITNLLNLIDEKSMTLGTKHKAVYSDGKEELTIIYRRIKEDSSKP